MIKSRCISLIIFGVISLTPFSFSACGRKGDPLLPEKSFSARAVDLEAEVKGSDLILKGRITGLGVAEKAGDRVRGCRLQYGRYPLNHPPCDGCPIEYGGYHEFGSDVIDSQGLSIRMPGIMKGGITFIRVHLLGPGGVVGPPSGRVRIAVK